MKILKTFAVLALGVVAFAGGYVFHAARAREVPAPESARRVLYYVDPMHPAYRSDKPGIAPDCGMTLEPVYADGGAAPGGEASTAPPGAIRIAPDRQQLIGVRFATVEPEGGVRGVRTVGKVAYDETRVARVHTRFEGWIEQVFVDFVGAVVKKGDPMFTVYSPEMLASQQELLLAAKARDLLASGPLPGAAAQTASLFEAAKRRLELWGFTEEQVAHLLETKEPIHSIPVMAPAAGSVIERTAFPNQKILPESDLYTIVDLSRVWILAEVFEADISSVRIGQVVRVTLPNVDAAPLSARVAYIQPQVDPTTRTIKVRLEVANPGMRFKPDMFVNVEFSFPQPIRLTVPASAVLDTGDRQTAFVDRGDGYFEPRAVRLGERLADRVVVLGGLTAGERVVSSGTFLVDAESQLKAAVSGAGAPAGHVHPGASAPDAAAPSKPVDHVHD